MGLVGIEGGSFYQTDTDSTYIRRQLPSKVKKITAERERELSENICFKGILFRFSSGVDHGCHTLVCYADLSVHRTK